MKTRAKAILTRKSTGMVAVEMPSGRVTVFELLGCELVDAGEFVTGSFDEPGNQVIHNETRDEKLRVFIHEPGCDLMPAIEHYFALSAQPRRPMWPGRNAARPADAILF